MREGVFGDGDGGGDTGLIGATAENGKWPKKDCLESFLYTPKSGGLGGRWKKAEKGLFRVLFVYP